MRSTIPAPDHLRFELEPTEGGTTLNFTVLLDECDKAARDAAGWHVCLDRLAQHVSGGAAEAPGSQPTDEWRGYSDEYDRRGLPVGAEIPGA